MKILILSGNGALVGASFYQDVIKTLNQSHSFINDNEYPEIILYNLPLEMNSDGILKNYYLLEKKLLEFNNLNIDYLFVLCNSISSIVSNIINVHKLNYKFINIIDNTLNKINNLNNKILLCSDYSNSNKLYGNNIIYLDNTKQQMIDVTIYNILKGNNVINSYNGLITYLNSFENIVLGCTELYFIKHLFDSNKFNVYDSLSLYKDTLVQLIIKGK